MELSVQSDADASSLPHQCSFCQRTFSRHEHLTRHVRSHTRERPFGCPTCGKHFARQDILNRHTAFHEVEAERSRASGAPRACLECAASRVRCSRGAPCRRCSEKSLSCEYPRPNKRRAAFGRGATVHAELEDPNGSDTAANIPNDESEEVADISHDLVGRFEGPVVEVDGVPSASDPREVSWGASLANTVDVARFESQPGQAGGDPNAFSGLDTARSFYQGLPLAVNWMSPDDAMMRDWDLQLSMLGYPVASAPSLPPFTVDPTQPESIEERHWQTGLDNPIALTPAEATRHPDYPFTHRTIERAVSVSEGGQTDNGSNLSTSSKYYVDGTGARAPFKGMSHERRSRADITTLSEAMATSPSSLDAVEDARRNTISPGTYNHLLQKLQSSSEASGFFLDLSCIPPLNHMAVFVKLYFDKFHPVFPFVQANSLAQLDGDGVLLLAVAAVGASYIGKPGTQDKEKLSRILRSVLQHRFYAEPLEDLAHSTAPVNKGNFMDNISAIQASILNCVCLFYSGRPNSMRRAAFERSYLVEAANALHLLDFREVNNNDSESVDSSSFVERWLMDESKLRTGFMIWVVDFLIAYESHSRPMMQTADACAPLPCPEEVWGKPSVESIKSYQSTSMMMLPEALEMLYMEKKLPANIGEFAATVLVNAICRRTREIYYHSQTQLSVWTPSARTYPRIKEYRVQESWPPATALLSGWRNGACDSLDILHWAANAKAAQRAGWEHPTILQLHIARLILLTPTVHLEALIPSPVGHERGNNAKITLARSHVTQWAIRDQFKARLSVVHAGALLWHVRRYSTDCILEPFGIYIATLAIWAYSVTTQSVRRSGESEEQASADSGQRLDASLESISTISGSYGNDPDPEPLFIHLDRPCDDEIVQTYVQSGHKMKGYMHRVGSICSQGAPSKILQEGIRLLVGATPSVNREASPVNETGIGFQSADSDAWGIERVYAHSLQKLLKEGGAGWQMNSDEPA
ncbi:hypothetical protein GQ53DRAFT_851567 [Thozetella sp. PMI_491]|nr:hypothetical protein GQ53DRAFT_851567 [Thozetella sp. PMI_491]